MLKHLVVSAMTLVLGLLTSVASAYFDPPWITPENPQAGEMLSIHIHGGVCDGLFESSDYPQVEQENYEIRFIVFGAHVEDMAWCIYGDWTATFEVGAFPPGNYALAAEMRYTDFFGMPAVLDIGTVTFTVRGLPPKPVPATQSVAWIALLALVAAAGVLSIRRGCRIGWLPLLLFAFASPDLRAESYALTCLKGGGGAPTPAQVVDWLNANPRSSKPPLAVYSAFGGIPDAEAFPSPACR